MGKEENKNEYLYKVAAIDRVCSTYWIRASSDLEAIVKCIEGDYEDCELGSVEAADTTEPIIVSKELSLYK